jgi:hypothetical protein
VDRNGLAILVNSDDPFNAKTAVGVQQDRRTPAGTRPSLAQRSAELGSQEVG